MNLLKKIIPSNENFFHYNFSYDSFEKMRRLYLSDIDEWAWTKLRSRFWPDTVLKQIIDHGKLNETTKQKNSKL